MHMRRSDPMEVDALTRQLSAMGFEVQRKGNGIESGNGDTGKEKGKGKRLSMEAHRIYMKAGLCFACGQSGHTVAQRPNCNSDDDNRGWEKKGGCMQLNVILQHLNTTADEQPKGQSQ